jgi:hypothetical protein
MSDLSEKYGFEFVNVKDHKSAASSCSIRVFELIRKNLNDTEQIKKLLLFPDTMIKIGEPVVLHYVGDKEKDRPLLARCRGARCDLCSLGLGPFMKFYFYGIKEARQIVYFSLSEQAAAETMEALLFLQKTNKSKLDFSDINSCVKFDFCGEHKNKQVPSVRLAKGPKLDASTVKAITDLPQMSEFLAEKYPPEWSPAVLSVMTDPDKIQKIIKGRR